MVLPLQILLLEDDPAIARTVAFALEREGFVVLHHLLVREAQQAAARQCPAAAILDVGLPDGSGLELLKVWRAEPAMAALPVLMLTARAEEIDRVLGLELGADDYLCKPFSPRELVARVRALLRRAAQTAAPSPAGSPFEVDVDGQRIRFEGVWLALTRLEHGLLCALLAAPTRIHTRDALLQRVWGVNAEATDRTVDTHIKTLRAKLREVQPLREVIATHRGLGYSVITSTAQT
jgi:two-component system, OmpR family, catabolic regulation response regulator CreB